MIFNAILFEEILSFILGTIAIIFSYKIEKELEAEYYEEDALKLLEFPRFFFFVALHAIFFPWAYFKPWKVREGYPLLLAEILLFGIGAYLDMSVIV